jgi:nucleoside-diphosphate-sugar epimerase
MTAVSENRKIVVTGASSYLGRNVIEGLLEAGNWQVVGIVSPRFDTANCAMGSTNLVYLNQDLTQALSSTVLSAIRDSEVILHFAWLRHEDAQTAIAQNIAILDKLAAAKSPESTLITMSSVAGSPTAVSSYGQAKYALNEYSTEKQFVALACGLVCAREPIGPYKQLTTVSRALPITIVPVGPAPDVYPVWINDVVDGLCNLCGHPPPGGVYRFWGSHERIDQFLRRIQALYPRLRVPVPVPFAMINPLVNVLVTLRLMPATIGDKLKTFLNKDDDYLATLKILPHLNLGPVDPAEAE